MMILFDSIIRSSIVVAIALFAVSILLRKRSASLRHFVLAMAVLVAAITPALTVLLPSLNLGRLVVQPEVFERLYVESPVIEETTTRAVNAGWFPNQPADFIVPIWLAGVLISLSGLVSGGIRLARIVSVSHSVTQGTWTAAAARICKSYGLPQRVRLLQTKNPSILVTWGLLKPKILLPAGADRWTEDRVQAVLSHELAHIRRHDWLIQLAAETLRTVYWFNPLVWVLCNRLRLESEYACDDAAISQGISGTEYAGHLLDLARTLNSPGRSWSAVLAMARPSTVQRRFSAMLNPTLNRRPVTLSTKFAVALIILFASLPLAATSMSPRIVTPPPALTAITPPIISQTTTGRVSGTVSDSRAVVVAGATVIISTPEGRTHGTTTTNGSGAYTFIGLRPGQYVLQVFANSFGPSRFTPVSVSSGQEVRQELKLDIGFVQEPIATGEGSIEGTVIDAKGLAIPGVEVTLASIDLQGGNRSTLTKGIEANATPGGYRFPSLPRGTYQVRFRLPGFKTLNIEGIRVLDRPTTVKATLQVATIAEEITIKSSPSTPSQPPSPAPECSALLANVSSGQRGLRGSFQGMGGNVQQARLLGQMKPTYPDEAKTRGLQGSVIMEAVMGINGRIIDTKVIAGHPILASAATDAIKQWCYAPTLLDGTPVETVSTVTVHFILEN